MSLRCAINNDILFTGNAFEVPVNRGTVESDHGNRMILPYRRPVPGRTLRVRIDQQHVMASELQRPCKVRSNRGFPRAAFLVQHRDHLHVLALSNIEGMSD
jgi:hypothetical protein